MKDYYKLLGVSNFADDATIKGAYRRLALYYHPDINKAQDSALKFIEIKTAYDTLINPTTRATYDYQLRQSQYQPKQPQEPNYSTTKNNSKQINWSVIFICIWVLFRIFSGSKNTEKYYPIQSYTHQYNSVNQQTNELQTPMPSNTIFVNNKLQLNTGFSITSFNNEIRNRKMSVIMSKENDDNMGGYGLKK